MTRIHARASTRTACGWPRARERFDVLSLAEPSISSKLQLADPAVDANVAQHAERLMRRMEGGPTPGAFAAATGMHQIQTMAAPASQVDIVVQNIYDDIKAIRMVETGLPAFSRASVHFVRRDDAVGYRTKLAPILLRLAHDESLSAADLSVVVEASARGDLVFASSSGLGSGLALLDVYLAPLFGAMTPSAQPRPAYRRSPA
jgi:hypothetical protein